MRNIRGEQHEILGYQRPEVLAHVAEIRAYLESDRPMIPNAVVIAFDATVLRDALGRLRPANSQGELYLTDVLGLVHDKGLPVGAHSCTDPWLVAGVNDRVQLAAVGAELNRRLLEHWIRQANDPGQARSYSTDR